MSYVPMLDPPGRGPHQPGQQRDQGRLARAGRTDQGDHLARRDGEVHPGQRDHVARLGPVDVHHPPAGHRQSGHGTTPFRSGPRPAQRPRRGDRSDDHAAAPPAPRQQHRRHDGQRGGVSSVQRVGEDRQPVPRARARRPPRRPGPRPPRPAARWPGTPTARPAAPCAGPSPCRRSARKSAARCRRSTAATRPSPPSASMMPNSAAARWNCSASAGPCRASAARLASTPVMLETASPALAQPLGRVGRGGRPEPHLALGAAGRQQRGALQVLQVDQGAAVARGAAACRTVDDRPAVDRRVCRSRSARSLSRRRPPRPAPAAAASTAATVTAVPSRTGRPPS